MSNVALILGMSGATTSGRVVLVAGLAGLVAGAISMAAGEWVSMRAQKELLERELERERDMQARWPAVEEVELALIYESRGVDPGLARQIARQVMSDPDTALEIHAREELGVNPGQLGSPWGAAISSFFAFGAGAVIPLLPWFFAEGSAATWMSGGLAGLFALGVGVLLAYFTDRPWWRSGLRQVFITAGAAAITFAIGSAVGIGLD